MSWDWDWQLQLSLSLVYIPMKLHLHGAAFGRGADSNDLLRLLDIACFKDTGASCVLVPLNWTRKIKIGFLARCLFAYQSIK